MSTPSLKTPSSGAKVPSGPIPRRLLGRTGQEVTQFALGGEGVLRTHGRMPEAVAVIHRALDQGVTYCDTAPAYAGSLDYYGAALGERRSQVFLASKTHDRTRDGSLGFLTRASSERVPITSTCGSFTTCAPRADLQMIFGRGGALEALVQARAEGRVRFLGLTGHHDPAILLEAMSRFDFDTVLIALNAADTHRLSFARTVLPEAARRGMGVIGMKVYAAGVLLRGGANTAYFGRSHGLCPEPAWRLDRDHRLLQPGRGRRKRRQRPRISTV